MIFCLSFCFFKFSTIDNYSIDHNIRLHVINALMHIINDSSGTILGGNSVTVTRIGDIGFHFITRGTPW